MLLHDRKELDNDLGRRTDHDLSLTATLSVVDAVQAVVKNGDANHFVMSKTSYIVRLVSKCAERA